jgi:hypothetical protein
MNDPAKILNDITTQQLMEQRKELYLKLPRAEKFAYQRRRAKIGREKLDLHFATQVKR